MESRSVQPVVVVVVVVVEWAVHLGAVVLGDDEFALDDRGVRGPVVGEVEAGRCGRHRPDEQERDHAECRH
ncbi:hypothetical protein [Haloferax sp. DFSO52]|uniref:hypothetical protein n=1 Tax=Haloferax sp. DFSO52 TaxID=3388505 RepID=UPI003A890FBC